MAKKDLTTFKVKLELNDKGAVTKINGMKTNLEGMGNQGKKSVGGLNAGFAKMAVGIGSAVVALGTLKKAFDFAVQVGGDFQQAMANVKAISGATGTDFQNLEQDALRLGASTKFTASQVAGLQLEYSKLGLSSKQIVNATEATLALASATGEDLASTAMVAGATLKGFGLEAREMGRVTDVMALSFSSSALDLEKFRESMKMVAPVAKGVGFTIEETTAILGEMANVGLHGSLAGTALKNIFIKMGDEGGKLAKKFGKPIKTFDELKDALVVLKKENVNFQEALGLTDKRAVTAFLALADGAERVGELKSALDEASGSADRMAKIQMDTLQGSMLELTSATEGVGIAMFDHFSVGIQNAVDGMTSLVSSVKAFLDIPLSRKMDEDRIAMNGLFEVLKDANTPLEDRRWAIERLNVEYKDYIPYLIDEKTNIEDIAKAQGDANDKYMQSIILRTKEEKLLQVIASHDKALEKRRVLKASVKAMEFEIAENLKKMNVTAEDAMKIAESKLDMDSRSGRITIKNKRDLDAMNYVLYIRKVRLLEGEQAKLAKTSDAYKDLDDDLKAVEDRYNELAKAMGKLSFGEKESVPPPPPDIPPKDGDAPAILISPIDLKLEEEFLSKSQDLFKFNLTERRALLEKESDHFATLKEHGYEVDKYFEIKKRDLYLMTAQYFIGQMASSTKAMAQAGMIGGQTAKRVAQLEATVQAFVNANKAYGQGLSLPPPLGIVMGPLMATLALGAGLAQVRMIEKQKFALGGAVKKPTMALIGEGGQEEFIAPKQQFKDWATEQLGEMNINADNTSTIGKLDEIHTAITSQSFPSSKGIAEAVTRNIRGRM
jgi:TP901 family phage tail tape measure protein